MYLYTIILFYLHQPQTRLVENTSKLFIWVYLIIIEIHVEKQQRCSTVLNLVIYYDAVGL